MRRRVCIPSEYEKLKEVYKKRLMTALFIVGYGLPKRSYKIISFGGNRML